MLFATFAVVTLSLSKGLSHFENLSVIVLLAIMFISYSFLYALVIFRNKSQKRNVSKKFLGYANLPAYINLTKFYTFM